jgi:hypothetical protein
VSCLEVSHTQADLQLKVFNKKLKFRARLNKFSTVSLLLKGVGDVIVMARLLLYPWL